jgi:hypothetical protein
LDGEKEPVLNAEAKEACLLAATIYPNRSRAVEDPRALVPQEGCDKVTTHISVAGLKFREELKMDESKHAVWLAALSSASTAHWVLHLGPYFCSVLF